MKLTPKNLNIHKKNLETIYEKDIFHFMNGLVLAEINNKQYLGTLNKFKNKYALINEEMVQIKFDLHEVTKLTGKNKKTNLFETISSCGDHRYCVKSHKGKNLGGPYKTKSEAKNRLRQVEYFKHMHEASDPLLKERLENLFFSEEVVNKDHKGKMSKSMQSDRDRIEKKLKNVKVVKGPPGRDDTPKEARFRLATYIAWKKKHGGD